MPMPSNVPAPASANRAQEMRMYEEARAALRELLARRERLRAEIAEIGETIERQEVEYVESNPAGNIIQGWDGLLRGGADSKRRKSLAQDSMRIFSRSHISYNPNATAVVSIASAALSSSATATSAPASSSSTPVLSQSGAPTPHSTTFARGSTGTAGDGAPNVLATTLPLAAGASGPGKANKRSRRQDDDSDTERRDVKKARVSTAAPKR